jgi:transposase
MAPGNRKNPKRAGASEATYSVVEFMRDFPDDETCLVWLWNTRYNLGDDRAHCERCGEVRTFRRYVAKQQRQDWTCTACGLHVHPTAGTIFHKSSTSLRLWFYAMYLMTSTRCGISAKQLEREIGVTYKTAWRMFNLIRNELMVQDDDEPLSGTVEMDETYVGGKPRNADKATFGKNGRSRQADAIKWSHEKKSPVFGMVERSGRIRAYVVPKKPQQVIMGHIADGVDAGAVINTDDARMYDRLAKIGFDHRVINHSEHVYVSGEIHTQTIDGFWSLVKRGISGTHHSVSPKWLQGYINEYVFRWNNREAGEYRRLSGQEMFSLLLLRSALPIVSG